MRAFTRNLLAGAVLAVLPIGGAMACTTSAWSSEVGTPEAGNPTGGVARYSGECGLSAAGGEFVVSEHPENDSVYRARFYVYTSTATNTTVFQAADAGDVPVITVQYLPGSNAFSFAVPGSTIANVTGIDPNRWYGVEVFREVGVPAQVFVRGGGGGGPSGAGPQSTPKVDASATGTGSASGNGVDVARLGSVAGGNVLVDEFESTRSTTTQIGFLLRADANNSQTVDAGDVAAIAREAVGTQTFTGQPDCNESGTVDAGDIACVARVAVGL